MPFWAMKFLKKWRIIRFLFYMSDFDVMNVLGTSGLGFLYK